MYSLIHVSCEVMKNMECEELRARKPGWSFSCGVLERQARTNLCVYQLCQGTDELWCCV